MQFDSDAFSLLPPEVLSFLQKLPVSVAMLYVYLSTEFELNPEWEGDLGQWEQILASILQCSFHFHLKINSEENEMEHTLGPPQP